MSKIEKFWKAIGGRKFLGFILATFLCFYGKISGEIWLVAFAIYCGANVIQKLGLNLKEVSKE